MIFVNPSDIAAPAGKFSHGVVANGFVFVSGTVGVDPNGTVGEGGITAQTHQAISNVEAILREGSVSLSDVVSATVYLADMADYRSFVRAWSEHFGDHCPARATVEARLVHPSLLVEIQVIAQIPVQKAVTLAVAS